MKLEPNLAAKLGSKIFQYKWLLSEKLGRDVGLRTACIDFLENMDQAPDEYISCRRTTILEHYLSKLNTGQVEMERIIEMTSGFIPADIQNLFQQVAHFAFEQEFASKEDYLVTAETFGHIRPKEWPSLSDDVIKAFEKDSVSYSRV
jgi:hypothetical protein